jgi:hypothetical protein
MSPECTESQSAGNIIVEWEQDTLNQLYNSPIILLPVSRRCYYENL